MWLFSESSPICRASWISSLGGLGGSGLKSAASGSHTAGLWPPPTSCAPTVWRHLGTWEFGFVRPVGGENSLPYSKGAITPYTCLWLILLLTFCFKGGSAVWRRKIKQPALSLLPGRWQAKSLLLCWGIEVGGAPFPFPGSGSGEARRGAPGSLLFGF